jgi:SAM-dependent methyltransferase
MKPSDFSQIAGKYEKTSLVQNSASDELFYLLGIKESDDVLDLGCGTGHLTKRIREMTKGNVVGIDSSQGMIEEARRNYGNLGISLKLEDQITWATRMNSISYSAIRLSSGSILQSPLWKAAIEPSAKEARWAYSRLHARYTPQISSQLSKL